MSDTQDGEPANGYALTLEAMKQDTPGHLTLPDYSSALRSHLSVTPEGVVRLGGPWAVRLRKLARVLLVVVLTMLAAVAVARALGVGWTPRYVSLVALGFGAALLLSTLGARPRNPRVTGAMLTPEGMRIRALGYVRPVGEVFALSEVRRLSLEGVCNQFTNKHGDMAPMRRRRERAMNKINRQAERQVKAGQSQYESDLLYGDISDLHYTNLALVAELEGGREVIIASQPCDAPIERLLALGALLAEHGRHLGRKIVVTPARLVKLPKESDTRFADPGGWVFGHREERWLAIGMLASVLVSAGYWLLSLPYPFLGTADTPGWLLAIYGVAPYLPLLPLVMAIFTQWIRPPEVMLCRGDVQSRRVTLFAFLAVLLALYAFLGMREVDLGVPFWVKVTAGVVLVLSIILRPVRVIVWLVVMGVCNAVSVAYTQTKTWHAREEATPLQRVWHGLLLGSVILAMAVMGFFLLVGLGKLSGALMSMTPGGGGGKTAIPLYFDIIVVGMLVACLPIMRHWPPLGQQVGLVAVMLLFAWLVLVVGIPGMAQLNIVGITFYLSLNALLVQHLLA